MTAMTRVHLAILGERMIKQYNITLLRGRRMHHPVLLAQGNRTSLNGRAFYPRKIIAPWPTTTANRLYILAHEVGHIVLCHCKNNDKPEFIGELEAEGWAHDELRRLGVPVPPDMTSGGKAYVRRCRQKYWKRIRRSRIDRIRNDLETGYITRQELSWTLEWGSLTIDEMARRVDDQMRMRHIKVRKLLRPRKTKRRQRNPKWKRAA